MRTSFVLFHFISFLFCYLVVGVACLIDHVKQTLTDAVGGAVGGHCDYQASQPSGTRGTIE